MAGVARLILQAVNNTEMPLLYGARWHSRLVPWIVAARGAVAASLHFVDVSLPVFVGFPGPGQVGPRLGRQSRRVHHLAAGKGVRDAEGIAVELL